MTFFLIQTGASSPRMPQRYGFTPGTWMFEMRRRLGALIIRIGYGVLGPTPDPLVRQERRALCLDSNHQLLHYTHRPGAERHLAGGPRRTEERVSPASPAGYRALGLRRSSSR